MCETLKCERVYSWNIYDDSYMVVWYEYADYDHLICYEVRLGSDLQPDEGTLQE
jgi:hypothetical protein